MILTTLEPYHTVVAEFRCRRWRLLKEALNSPLRHGCKKPRHILEVCNPKLVYDKRDRKLYLTYVVRKLVSLDTLEELENTLNGGFNIVSVDVNLDDVVYAVFHVDNVELNGLHIDRYRLNIDEWMKVRSIDAWSKRHHGMAATRQWTKLKHRGTAKGGEVANEVLKVAKKFDAKAIVYERLSKKFPKRGKDCNYKIHRWYYARILRYLDNKARWEGLAAFPVPAGGTSSRCSRCNARLPNPETRSHRDWQVRRCRRCGFTDDRDHIACTNIAKKFIIRLLKLRLRHILSQMTTHRS